jgi:hypothetical protein
LNQVQKGKHLTAIHVRILQNFPLQTGLFMARQHGHHLNTVADMTCGETSGFLIRSM